MSAIRRLFAWTEAGSAHRLMFAIVAALGVGNLLFGERVPAGGGLGWDGVTYGAMVRDLEVLISSGTLSAYYAQRILPSTIVGVALRALGAELNTANVIRGFELYNLALLLAACWSWRRISDGLALGVAGRWIGFSGLFLSFHFSKLIFYNAVITDATALLAGLLMLQFYLERRTLPLLATSVLGAFAWPVASFYGALLLALPRATPPADDLLPLGEGDTPLDGAGRALMGSWAILLALCIGLLAIDALGGHPFLRPRFAKILTALPSIAAGAIAVLYLVASPGLIRSALSTLRRPGVASVLLAVACLLLPRLVVGAISNPALPNANNLRVMHGLIFFPATGKILLPFVSLAVTWGPVLLLLALRWRAFCEVARRLGLGFVAVVTLTIPLGLAAEPRFVAAGWPFFVLGAALVTERLRLPASFKWVFGGITVLFAQFWLRINYRPWIGEDSADLLSFPKQLLFMHYGLWTAWGPFLLQLAVLLVCMVMLERSLRGALSVRSLPSQSASRPAPSP